MISPSSSFGEFNENWLIEHELSFEKSLFSCKTIGGIVDFISNLSSKFFDGETFFVEDIIEDEGDSRISEEQVDNIWAISIEGVTSSNLDNDSSSEPAIFLIDDIKDETSFELHSKELFSLSSVKAFGGGCGGGGGSGGERIAVNGSGAWKNITILTY